METEEGDLFAGVAQALEALVTLRERSDAIGQPVCAAYIEGSAEALRTAREHLRLESSFDLSDVEPGLVRLQHSGLALRAKGANGLADCGVLCQRDGDIAFTADDGFDEEPWPSTPDLGSALLDDPAIAALAGYPWAAALLADALCSHEWLHMASGETRSLTRSAANALVRVAAGGRGFPEMAAGETRGLVDVRVAEALARIGWRRLRGPQTH